MQETARQIERFNSPVVSAAHNQHSNGRQQANQHPALPAALRPSTPGETSFEKGHQGHGYFLP
jgi:hypothetical protein